MTWKFARFFGVPAVLAIVIACCFMVIAPQRATAAINPQINFQGKLTNTDGTNVTNGTFSIVFSIYNVASAGTALWTETQSTVTVTDGIFQVKLGSVTPLPGSIDFNTSSIYLGIKVGADAEMIPRVQFTASPYAFNSDTVDGLDSTGFVQMAQGVQTDASSVSSIFINKTGAAGNLLQLQKSGTDALTVSNTGQTTVASASYLSNLFTINNGNSGAMPTIPGSYLPSLTVRVNETSGSRPLFFGYDNGAGAWDATLNAGACGAFTQMCLDFGAGATSYTGLYNNGTTLGVGGGPDGNFLNVVIGGAAATDAVQTLLQLDSFDTFADTAGCTTIANQGGLYYNTRSNSVRGCVNGGWEDMVSTAALGMQLFGVVPDSGAVPGDLASASSAANIAGPCKVSAGVNLQTVSWTACLAYSGGRKVIVAAGTQATTNAVAGNFQHLCLTGANGQPVLSATGVETANLATVSMPSVTTPILCLADIRFNAANTTITQVYDTRTYTDTEKIPVTINSAAGLSALAISIATKGAVQTTNTANTNNIAGVIVATTGAASTTTVNAIMATGGPAAVKSITGSNTVNAYIFTGGTAGYATTNTAKPVESTTTIYNVLGNARTAWSGATACTVSSDTCAGSVLTYIDKR